MRLSTMYAWMKNWPHGVMVVPMAAMAVRIQRLFICALGTTVPWIAAPQSGRARKPAMKYAMYTAVRARNTRSTLR